MTRVTVEVTQTDIDQGCAGNNEFCPIARAIQRVIPGLPVRVGPVNVFLGDNELDLLSPRAQRFITDFDAGRRRRPFIFMLDIPAGLLEASSR